MRISKIRSQIDNMNTSFLLSFFALFELLHLCFGTDNFNQDMDPSLELTSADHPRKLNRILTEDDSQSRNHATVPITTIIIYSSVCGGVIALIWICCACKMCLTRNRERRERRPGNTLTIKEINIYFPVQTFGSILHKYNQTNCAICLEDYTDTSECRMICLCNHIFHSKCIEKWLQAEQKCPICKLEVSKKELEKSKHETIEMNVKESASDDQA